MEVIDRVELITFLLLRIIIMDGDLTILAIIIIDIGSISN